MRNRKSAIGNRKSGVTLVELMVTMGVVAILMLGGVGVYFRMNRGFALQAATSSIESALRAARHTAVYERSPAVVVAVPHPEEPAQVGAVYALGRQTLSNWHFEHPSQFTGDGVLGALGQKALLKGGTLAHAPGRIGTALALDGNTRLEATTPYLDGLRDGVFVECFVNPQAASDGVVMAVASREAGGAAQFWLGLVAAPGGRAFAVRGRASLAGGATLPEITTEPLVPAGEWTHLALSCYRDGPSGTDSDRFVLALDINGEEGAKELVQGANLSLAPSTAALNIGSDGSANFSGLLDELKVAGLVAGETRVMPRNTEVFFEPKSAGPWRVHFDREGKLDPTHHPTGKAVSFRTTSTEDRLLRVVRVNRLGAIEVFQGEPPAED